MTGRNGFIPLMGQDEIDRLNELERRRQARRHFSEAVRRALGWGLLLAGQIALLVAVAAQHEAWPW